MPVQKLIDAGVLALQCPEGRSHLEVFDTLMRGLYVDVMANGRMAYRVRYRLHGKQRVLTLGDARLLTLEEARAAARTALRRALVGDDPRSEAPPAHGPTLATFYLEQYLPYVKSYKRSWSTDETMIRHHLLPTLGERAMGSVIPPDIARLVEAMRGRGYAAGTCNRALVLVRYGYTLALRWGIEGVEQNPAKALKGLKEDNRIERFLTPEQTQRLLAAVCESQNPLLASIVAFLIYTGARVGVKCWMPVGAMWICRASCGVFPKPNRARCAMCRSRRARYSYWQRYERNVHRRAGSYFLIPAPGFRLYRSFISGMPPGSGQGCLSCASTICAIALPAFWSTQGVALMKYRNC